MSDIDSKIFRNALGSFATGVAVVTALDPQDKPMGLTINSFASLSLDPPLVLWSIDQHSDLYDQFCQADHYAIHVLREDQQPLSNHFTKAGDDQFDQIDIEHGISALPLLFDYTARFQCKVVQRYEGGDHVILVGHVLDIKHSPAQPLIFHAGQYAKLE
jgi:4-hydroxyphenylacetate 3-hydroxylase, reductase component